MEKMMESRKKIILMSENKSMFIDYTTKFRNGEKKNKRGKKLISWNAVVVPLQRRPIFQFGHE